MIGIDEVGRGPWAGPLVIASVFLKKNLEGLDDSKKINSSKRIKLSREILKNSFYRIVWFSAFQIDTNGLSRCLRDGFNEAYRGLITQNLLLKSEKIVIDGNVDFINNHLSSSAIKADSKYSCVSAASIIAKVARDEYMHSLDKKFPEYGFISNVGYGTKKHREALLKHGPIENIHRMSFKPVRDLI